MALQKWLGRGLHKSKNINQMQLEVNHHIIKMPLTVFSVWYIKHSISYSQCSLSQTRQERREQQERENKIVRERQQEKEGDGRTQKNPDR